MESRIKECPARPVCRSRVNRDCASQPARPVVCIHRLPTARRPGPHLPAAHPVRRGGPRHDPPETAGAQRLGQGQLAADQDRHGIDPPVAGRVRTRADPAPQRRRPKTNRTPHRIPPPQGAEMVVIVKYGQNLMVRYRLGHAPVSVSAPKFAELLVSMRKCRLRVRGPYRTLQGNGTPQIPWSPKFQGRLNCFEMPSNRQTLHRAGSPPPLATRQFHRDNFTLTSRCATMHIFLAYLLPCNRSYGPRGG